MGAGGYIDPTGYLNDIQPETFDHDDDYSGGGGTGGSTGGGEMGSYNYSGPYSLYVRNPTLYGYIYGTSSANWVVSSHSTLVTDPYIGKHFVTDTKKSYNLTTYHVFNASSRGSTSSDRYDYWTDNGDWGMLLAGGGNMANYAPMPYNTPIKLRMKTGLDITTPQLGVIANVIDKADATADVGGDLLIGGAATYFESHIETINKYYSYSKYKTPGDMSAFGMRYLTGYGVLKINTGLKYLGTGFNILGASTSISQALLYKSTNGKEGQHWGFTLGDLSTVYAGYRVGGWYGFAISAGWTFIAKPILQMTPQERYNFFYFNSVNANQNIFFK